jgi:glutathione S-transferase
MTGARQTTLWHLPTSHYSEKVRWALEYKAVSHARRLPKAVPHFLVARQLTRGEVTTFPVVRLPDGRVVGDSTAIIAALEDVFPEPPLYPTDAADRSRALELEEWFDEQLGTHVRVLALHEAAHDPRTLRELSSVHAPLHMRPFPRLWARGFGAAIRRRYGLDRLEAVDAAREAVGRAFDRLEAELEGDHLVGDRFTVADLTAASHFYWLVQPPAGPRIISRLPAPLAEFMRAFEERPGYRWVLTTYARHRLRRPEPALSRATSAA